MLFEEKSGALMDSFAKFYDNPSTCCEMSYSDFGITALTRVSANYEIVRAVF